MKFRPSRIQVLSVLILLLSGILFLVSRQPYGFKDKAGRIQSTILDPDLVSDVTGIRIKTTRGTIHLVLSDLGWQVQDPGFKRFFPASKRSVEGFLEELCSLRMFEETGKGTEVRKELGLDDENAWTISLYRDINDESASGAESGTAGGHPDTPGFLKSFAGFSRATNSRKNPGIFGSMLYWLMPGMRPPASLIDSLDKTLLVGYTDDAGSRIHMGLSADDKVWSTDPGIFRIMGRDYRYWLDLTVFAADRLSAGIDSAEIGLILPDTAKVPSRTIRSQFLKNNPENHEILMLISTLSAEEMHFPGSPSISANGIFPPGEGNLRESSVLSIRLIWGDGRSSTLILKAPEPSGNSRFMIDNRPWEYTGTRAARLYESINLILAF